MRRIFFILTIANLFVLKSKAQSLPVGMPIFDDYYRREQLLGNVDSNYSFSIRPIFPALKSKELNIFDPDSLLKRNNLDKSELFSFAKGFGSFQILPFTWQQQSNSNHPYGWNDGAMIPAKGYQTMLSGGFYLKVGPLTIQLRPEYVYAINPSFNGFANSHSSQDLTNYAIYHYNIDWPEQFGNQPYKKLYWGQSSIRLNFSPISVGLSNENLWWGPGIRNSLILSNNAPGFKHLTLNTIRPINTPVGKFEGQIIASRLEASNTPLFLKPFSSPFPLKPDWRYFTGFNINYHPKWVDGLTIGLIRTFQNYGKDLSGFKTYVPFFIPYSKKSTTGGSEPGGIGDAIARDQLTSIYFRWLFTKAKAEVYFEYGLNDNSYNLNDFIGSPDHSRTYLFGVRKMISLNANDQHILLGAEITQLSQSPDRLVRDAGTWYVHSQIFEGHTHKGQIIGAGIGSGGNLQSMNINWVSGLKRLGFSFERYEHDVDFQQVFFPDINGNSRKWVDFAFGLQGEWNYKNLLFNANLQHIKSLNYQWILKDYVPGQYYIPHNDVYNFHGQLGLTYRF